MWLIIYQYAFEQNDYDELAEVFHEMENEEFGQNNDIGETIKIETSNLPSNDDDIYPKK